MGLLDDAIREHLELKRRRGADPDDLERAEREALGPVRRKRFASEEGELEGHTERNGVESETSAQTDLIEPEDRAAGAGDGELSEAEYEEYYEEEYYDDEELEEWDGVSDEAAVVHPPEPLHDETTAPSSASAPRRGSVPPESAPPTQANRPEERLDQITDEKTAEFSLEDEEETAPPAAPTKGGPSETRAEDDVLEETPEFLQDAPEHDRLWFEQRPPRDFDFDS